MRAHQIQIFQCRSRFMHSTADTHYITCDAVCCRSHTYIVVMLWNQSNERSSCHMCLSHIRTSEQTMKWKSLRHRIRLNLLQLTSVVRTIRHFSRHRCLYVIAFRHRRFARAQLSTCMCASRCCSDAFIVRMHSFPQTNCTAREQCM